MIWWFMDKSCVYPELMHKGRPVLAKNFRMGPDKILYMKCPETGRWFEMYVEAAQYKCCRKYVWIEKDFLFGGKVVIDLTKDEPPF